MTPTVGICEDDESVRELLRGALEAAGYAVAATARGAEAVTAFTRRPPDMIILDIGLPDADGRDVCHALRARGVACPVLFVSAQDDRETRRGAREAGGDDYLAKPFALAELLRRVRRLANGPPAAPSTPAASRSTARPRGRTSR
ncbi:MAG TPA: response regulator [Baekduia sp.]|uniref:response regulator transcription factor n=1 Tax=Baekduia sp. TaxID=2600305 RepID=UPI002D79B55B|nr:response regulator [Baekduia sp.]HET6505401.1 response regulator [Baekduia sp.]